MCDLLENNWNDKGQLTKSKRHIDETDDRGCWRETDTSPIPLGLFALGLSFSAEKMI